MQSVASAYLVISRACMICSPDSWLIIMPATPGRVIGEVVRWGDDISLVSRRWDWICRLPTPRRPASVLTPQTAGSLCVCDACIFMRFHVVYCVTVLTIYHDASWIFCVTEVKDVSSWRVVLFSPSASSVRSSGSQVTIAADADVNVRMMRVLCKVLMMLSSWRFVGCALPCFEGLFFAALWPPCPRQTHH